jgi:hypothetical protein
MAEAKERGEEFVEEELFSAKHVVKSEMWRGLSKNEKSQWRTIAKTTAVPEMYMDQ